MKKIISALLCILLMFSYSFYAAASTDELDEVISDASCHIINTVHSPTISSIGGEWSLIALAKSTENNKDFSEKYYENAKEYIKKCNGVLHERKYTEYARVILGLLAIDKNPANIEGYDITLPLYDYDKTIRQGINGAIWALIALDCGNYGNDEIKEKYIDYILKSELSGGGFALSKGEENADVDVTAMALTALSKHIEREDVKGVIERALERLSSLQNENGGFSNYGVENSESTSQVIVALASLGISHNDSRFIKNGKSLMDNLLSYYIPHSGFSHIISGETNLMATEQALCALISVVRLEKGESHIYDIESKKEKPLQNKFEQIAKVIYAMLKETGIL